MRSLQTNSCSLTAKYSKKPSVPCLLSLRSFRQGYSESLSSSPNTENNINEAQTAPCSLGGANNVNPEQTNSCSLGGANNVSVSKEHQKQEKGHSHA